MSNLKNVIQLSRTTIKKIVGKIAMLHDKMLKRKILIEGEGPKKITCSKQPQKDKEVTNYLDKKVLKEYIGLLRED